MEQTQTPMIRQYLSIKAQYKDAVLFFRLGDFYEMFFDEAVEVSRLLNLTLTQRVGVPMCGIPHHTYKIYAARLLRAGKKIAICEQTADTGAGGLAERKVTEVITPGTVVEEDFLEQNENNYLAALYCPPKKTEGYKGLDYYAAFAYIDVTTGDFYATSFLKKDFDEEFLKEIGRVSPREILVQQSLKQEFPILNSLSAEYTEMLQNFYPDWSFNAETAEKRLCECFGTENLKAFSLNSDSPELPPAGLLIEYLEQTAGKLLSHISKITIYSERDFVSIDNSTRKNLEILYNLRDNTSAYTLFETVNNTRTSMGARLLRHWLYHPLCSIDEITARLENVKLLYNDQKKLAEIRSILSNILDIERLAGRISMEKAHGKDLLALFQSLEKVIHLHTMCKENHFSFLNLTQPENDKLYEIYKLLGDSINENCPVSLTEGNLIKQGFSEEVDSLKRLHENAKDILDEYLIEERKNTNIPNLKIKYNNMLGHFLEVSAGYLSNVPDYFIKRRSISNADRFTTERLRQIEDDINGAEERLIELEKQIFLEIRSEVNKANSFLHKAAYEIAKLDTIQSLAHSAVLNAWIPPIFKNNNSLNIINGRHPVVEAHLPSGEFVPNSILLTSNPLGEKAVKNSCNEPSFALITGPNMAGKSTFLRQTALIVLLAQVGSFVPAEKAEICPVDKIFCRVGASDNLARGESTFLVEMSETAYILNTATSNSLIIMDEVGRGTSTEDGLAIAQSVTEYLLNKIGAKTLFATHYHELSNLKHKFIQNLKLDILETEGKIVFLKKVVKGISESSYGIHVAGLAGIPAEVLARAENLLYMFMELKKKLQLDGAGLAQKPTVSKEPELSLFSEEALIINEILSIDPNSMTPITALETISRWKKALLGS